MWLKLCFAMVETHVNLLLLSSCLDSHLVCEVGGGGGSFLPFLSRAGRVPCSAFPEACGYHYLHVAVSSSVPDPQRTAPELPWISLKRLSSAFLIT